MEEVVRPATRYLNVTMQGALRISHVHCAFCIWHCALHLSHSPRPPTEPQTHDPVEQGLVGQPRTLRGLKARVGRRGTPSRPLRRFRKVLERRRRAATSGLRPADVSGNRLPGDELGNGATFGPAQARALRAHGASQQGVDDGLGTAGTKSLETRRPRVGCACVAGRAGRLKYRGAIWRLDPKKSTDSS